VNAPVFATDERGFDHLVLGAQIPVLVDFWAPWCAPCQRVAPLVARLADQYAGELRAVAVNVEDHPGVARRAGIQGLPTLVLFERGREVRRFVGVRSTGELAEAVAELLAPRLGSAAETDPEGNGGDDSAA
jgi:thioredoxin